MPVEDNIILKAVFQRGNDEDKHNIEDIKHIITNEEILPQE